MKTFLALHNNYPPLDKLFALIGAISTEFSLSQVSTTVGIVVGITTFFMILPRAIMNWQEMTGRREKKNKK